MPVIVQTYLSPTLVLLAFDWPPAHDRADFLGFAIQRTPGFDGADSSWLPNRIGFQGPKPDQSDFPSNIAPIQKFYWWDARIDTKDRGSVFSYEVIPVCGSPNNLQLQAGESTAIKVTVPQVEENGITTHFNRAVVSSQAFSKQFPHLETASLQKAAQAWLANGMEHAVPDFMDRAAGKDVEGAIYHLTDPNWIMPALLNHGGLLSLAYNHTSKDHVSDDAIKQLIDSGRPESAFVERTHANIMHNKFLVRVGGGDNPEAVLAGSANFTSEGLSAQANVLHIFESPDLAKLYLARKRELDGNPSLSQTQRSQEGWSEKVTVGDATIRAYFPPESKGNRESIDAIIDAVENAQQSILICAYDPTDIALLNAIFKRADEGLMMRGLVNRVASKEPGGDPNRSDVAAAIAIMNRSSEDHDVVGFGAFKAGDTPTDFAPERVLWPGEDPKILVRVHHKFVVIDAEGNNPVVFTGSANFSGNSLNKNDENLLEISACPRLARIYFAEFLRLYEHYRARAAFDKRQSGDQTVFILAPNSDWGKKYFQEGTPEFRARVAMANAN
jgi:phosphatidylserine/phosphatidylglycerophosphate/cardiolipin synthase-like enzyme